MDKPFKFALPSPNFNKSSKDAFKPKPHFLTPSGMSLLPREKQPPPMYGKHGATVPAKFLNKRNAVEQQLVAAAPVPPPPEKQYCEPCELELQSLEDLKRHRAQHEKCPVEGCLYKGHPSVMDKHVNALHNSGLFDKFKKLSTPEEIAAWREERRKRYPTLANVLLKQKAKEQRQKRGERLEANKNRFGKINDRKRAQPNRQEDNNQVDEKKPREDNKINGKNHKNNRRNKNKRTQKTKQQEEKPNVQNENTQLKDNFEEENNSDISCAGIRMFKGTSQLKDYKHFSDKKKVVTNNVLYGLVGMYGSDDDDDEESENNDSDNEVQVVADNMLKESVNLMEVVNNESEEIMEIDDKINEVKDEVSNTNDVEPTLIDGSDTYNNIENTISNPNAPNISPSYDNNISNANNDLATLAHNSSDEAPEETPIQRNLPDYPIKPDKNQSSNSSEQPDTKLSQCTEQPSSSKQKKFLKRKSGLDYRRARLRKQNTMLEKLLEADIRHERNVLLQCVRYVCENNFFDIGQNNEKPD